MIRGSGSQRSPPDHPLSGCLVLGYEKPDVELTHLIAEAISDGPGNVSNRRAVSENPWALTSRAGLEQKPLTVVQLGSSEVVSFHTPPIKLLEGLDSFCGVVREPYRRLVTCKLPTCLGL